MYWALGFLILLIALLIPILAIVLDSPVARNVFRGTDPAKLNDVMERLQALEDEVAEMGQTIESLREESEFVQRLLDNPDGMDERRRLSPPKP
jgi:hypothetical protein